MQRKRRYATQMMRKKTSSSELPLSPSKKGNVVKFLTYVTSIIILGVIAYYIYFKSQPDVTVVVEKEIPEKTDGDIAAQSESTLPLEERTQVEILNGCGGTGVAKIFEAILRKEGFDVVNTDNYVENGKIRWDVPASRVIDLTGNTEQAEIIAEKLGIAETHVISQSNPEEIYDVRIIIGKDFKDLEGFKSFSR